MMKSQLVKKSYARNLVPRFGLLFLVAGALQVHAGKYYLKKINGDSDPTWMAYDGSKDINELSVEHDYVVRGYATNLTIKGINYTVNSLTIGENDIGGRMYLNKKKSSNTSTSITFQNDGLFLVKGSMRSQGVPCNIRGDITVSATRDVPFGVFPAGSNGEVRFNPLNSNNTSGGILYGSEESAMIIGLEYDLKNNVYLPQEAHGYLASFYNLGEYKGLISVTSKHENASCARGFGAAIQLCDPNAQFEGDLKICGGGALLFTNDITVVTVDELTLEPGSMIRTVADLTAKTCNRVDASALNVQGPVCVTADYEHPDSTDGEEIKLVLLTAPANKLSANHFYFRPASNAVNDYFLQQRAHLEVVTENDMDTLYLVVDPKGEIKISSGGTLSLTKNIVVSELTLESESVIRTTVDLTAKTCNSVATSKLNVNGPICVMADYQQKASTDGQEVRCALLTAPANGLKLDDFYFMSDPNVTDDSHTDRYQQRAHLEVVTEDGVATLYLVVEPIITLNDTDSADPTLFENDPVLENPDAWQDGSVPVGGRHYLNERKYLKFMGDTNYTFPGKSFIQDAGRVMFGGKREIVFSNYVWRSGHIYTMSSSAVKSDVKLKGKMIVSAKATNPSPPQTLRCFEAPIDLNVDISGSGNMIFSNTSAEKHNPYKGFITLSGNNSGYFGKIAVTNNEALKNIGITKEKCTSVYVSNGNNLGGTLNAFTFDALSLSKYARLIPTATMTLSKTSNRGLYVIGTGVIAPNENVTLRMEWPITMNGTLYKDGLGVLEMAGEIRFYDAENSTSVETPRAETDVLNLYKGTLKIGSAKACDGLRIDVQSGTSILLPKPGTDSNINKYGLYNVKAGATPFALGTNVTKLPIAFEEQLSAASLKGMVTNALFTVANSAVESVRTMLPYGVRPYQGVRASIVEIPLAEEEATTFACVTKQYGLMISIK